MIQHLLNTTAIWLLCLVGYDIFLRKETFHKYNRLYLLSTLLLGMLLPSVHWQKEVAVFHTPLNAPLQEIGVVKKSIEAAIAPAGNSFNINLIILFLYLTGVLFSLVLIGKDILLLARLYRKGICQKEGRWMIVTTNEPHGPFSIFNYLFVSNRKLYEEHEWQLLLRHEQQHATQYHFFDLLLIQLTRVLFWFHPLVYLYQYRLLLIHEYQADSVGSKDPSVYGTFLVEQAMLQANPAITHSFNRSPIKKRITMLTKRSSRKSMFKTFVAVPVVLCCLLCFTKDGYSRKGDGKNTIVFRGNTFEFGYPVSPVTASADPVMNGKPASVQLQINATPGGNGAEIVLDDVVPEGVVAEEGLSIGLFSAPLKMNGNLIYSDEPGLINPVFTGRDGNLTNYLFNNCREELGKLEDGEYHINISYPIIDEKGKMVYYENQGVSASYAKTIVNRSVKEKIDKKIENLMDDCPAYKPAKMSGTPVPYYYPWAFEMGSRIVVKDHKATLEYVKPTSLRR